jgi:hypothetical protein
MAAKDDFVMERKGRIEDLDRSFDVEYWQKLGPDAIFSAAWEMVVQAWEWKGRSADEPRLQRTVEHVQRL